MNFWDAFFNELEKLSFFEHASEAWGFGGEHDVYTGAERDTGSPLLHEQATPPDVDLKNFRSDHFFFMRTPPSEGKIKPGKLGKGFWRNGEGR